MSRPSEIRDFWLDGVDSQGVPSASTLQRWFAGGSEVDDAIRVRFGDDVERALAGDLDDWAEEPASRFALTILLDQFPRNLFRGTARSYAGDPRALALVKDLVGRGLDADQPAIERYFLYLPFEHSEALADQNRSLELFQELFESAPEEARDHLKGALEWAERHRVVIERFGRFPSRNQALGRTSTPEELAFLESTPAGF